MRRPCDECGVSYDDEFRKTYCPHPLFPANDGHNNFEIHYESEIFPAAPRCSRCGTTEGVTLVDWCVECGPTLQCASCDQMHHGEWLTDNEARADLYDWWKSQQ